MTVYDNVIVNIKYYNNGIVNIYDNVFVYNSYLYQSILTHWNGPVMAYHGFACLFFSENSRNRNFKLK